MISILAQERLLGFALGSVSMGGFVLHQRRSIYRSLADADAASGGASFSYQTSATTGRGVSAEMAHVWNKAVDETGLLYILALVDGDSSTESEALLPDHGVVVLN